MEFCVVELHIATSDVATLNCEYRCGISLHVVDLTSSPAKVSCQRFEIIVHVLRFYWQCSPMKMI